MPSRSSITRRVGLTVAGLFLASGVGVSWAASWFQDRQQEADLAADLHTQVMVFQSLLRSEADGLAQTQVALGRLDALLRPLAEGRAEELLGAARPLFEELKERSAVTHMYFLRPDGTVLLRVHKPEQSGDKVERATFRQAAASGQVAAGIELGKNFFSLRCVQPVSWRGQPAGYIEIAKEIDSVFERVKHITGQDVTLLLTPDYVAHHATDLHGVAAGSLVLLASLDQEQALALAAAVPDVLAAGLRGERAQRVRAGGRTSTLGVAPLRDAAGETAGVVAFHREQRVREDGQVNTILLTVGLDLAMLALCGLLLAWAVRGAYFTFTSMRRHILAVTSRWDLTRPLAVHSDDELGQLATDFNRMLAGLATMVRQTGTTRHALKRLAGSLRGVSAKVVEDAGHQTREVTATAAAAARIERAAQDASHAMAAVVASSETASNSVTTIVTGLGGTARTMEQLGGTVEGVSNAMRELTRSVEGVSRNAEVLAKASQEASSSAMRLDAAVAAAESSTRESVKLAEGVHADAQRGRQAVAATVAGIQEIRTGAEATSHAVHTLSQQVESIGSIVSVIDSVAAQTNLLAINASIIAAQAGEHGRSFIVVAEQIKDLATRTRRSTQEIAKVIERVQAETGHAVGTLAQALDAVSQGEELSRQSGHALEQIVSGVRAVTENVNRIAATVDEQGGNSRQVSASMERVAEMVVEIVDANRAQAQSYAEVLKSAEEMHRQASQVREATRDQSYAGAHVSTAVEAMVARIREIGALQEAQLEQGRVIVQAVARIQGRAAGHQEAARTLDHSVSRLHQEVEALAGQIDRFKVDDGDG